MHRINTIIATIPSTTGYLAVTSTVFTPGSCDKSFFEASGTTNNHINISTILGGSNFGYHDQ